MQMGREGNIESDSSILSRIEMMLPETGMLRLNPKGTKDLRKHTIKTISRLPHDVILRWGALYHDIGKPAVFANQFGSTFANHEDASLSIWLARSSLLGMTSTKINAIGIIISMHMRVQQFRSDWTNKAYSKLAKDCQGQLEKCIVFAIADGMPAERARVMQERGKKWKKQ